MQTMQTFKNCYSLKYSEQVNRKTISYTSLKAEIFFEIKYKTFIIFIKYAKK